MLIQGRVYVQFVWVKSNYTLLPTDHFFNTTEVMTKSTNNKFFPQLLHTPFSVVVLSNN